ncbi:uncharacterized protein [Asterias amurensis]|uniref:uncharacterized protein n=1 Tax=Asterias amurensis TaxID=7602 RepID=UPI003AB5493B
MYQEVPQDDRETLFSSTNDTEEEETAGLMNTWQSMFLMAGVCSSAALLITDDFVVSAGIGGILVLCVIVPAVVYTAVLLGRCWNMVRHKWQHERHPYGAIGYEAFGDVGRSVINFMVAVASFFGGVGSLVISAELLFLIDEDNFAGLFCYMPVVFVCFLIPFGLLGTPKDMWQIGALSIISSTMALILLIIGIALADYDEELVPSSRNATDVVSLAPSVAPILSYPLRLVEICGITLFAMDGHISYPTFFQDMLEPHRSTRVAIGAYGYLISSMILIIVASYIFIPSDLITSIASDGNVTTLLPRSPLTVVPLVFLFIHQCTVTLTGNNVLFQYMEERLDIPQAFGWRRVLSRSTILLLELFVGETIPHFGILSTLIGGICSPVLIFLAPCLCYIRLRSINNPEGFSESKNIWLLETAVCWVIIIFTPILMSVIVYVTTYSVLKGKTAFTVPCFVNSTLAHA